MPNKLKNLSVTSVDLVDQGANPEAHIRLFKRKEDEPETDPDARQEEVEKEASTFGENFNRELLRTITSQMFDCCYALSDSLSSIICDGTLDTQAKASMMLQSLDEFSNTVRSAAGEWAAGRKASGQEEPQAGIQKSAAQQKMFEKLWNGHSPDGGKPSETPQSEQSEQEVTATMKIDKSKMTPEEAAALAELEKKYGVTDDPVPDGEPAPPDSVEKGAEPPASGELHPEVQKALADFKELTKRQSAEVEELKKSLAIERLTAFAKKYEVLGKNAGELAAKLYELKKAGGTVYDDYVALLDENVTTLTKSGLFSEIGKNTQGSAGTVQALGIKAAELAKSADGGMSGPEAIIKAFEENPELAAQYEAEYRGGR